MATLSRSSISSVAMSSEETKTTGRRSDKVFFGWWTVLAAGVLGLWGFGSGFYSFGALFKPFSNHFGWTEAEIAGASAMRRVEGGVGGLTTGWFTDKFGPRLMCLLGTLIAGLGYILMYFVNSLWSFYLVYGVIVALGWTFGLTGNLDKAIAEWFVKRRGSATSIYRVVVALQIVPPLVTWFIATFGWRTAFVFMGLITWAIGFPLAWFFIRPKRPEYYGLLPDGETVNVEVVEDGGSMIKFGQEFVAQKYGEVEFSLGQAVRSRVFWVVALASAISSLLWSVVTVYLIPYLVDYGMNDIAAAAILSFLVSMSIPGRIVGGILVDRISIHKLKYVILAARCLLSFGLFLMIVATDQSIIYLFAVLIGLGIGLDIGAFGPMRTRFFGRKAYGTIMGVVSLLTFPVSAFAPIYIGWMYDVTGSYTGGFTLILIIYTIGLFSYLFLNPPKQKPDVVSDIEKLL